MESIRDQMASTLKQECDHFDLKINIIESIIQTESNWNPWVIRYEKEFYHFLHPLKYGAQNHITTASETISQQISWGLGQVMGGTARFMGFEGPLTSLLDPKINIHICCLYFAKNCKKYAKLEEQIASYNSGSVIYNQKKELINQQYVDKVLKAMAAIENNGTKT